MSGQHLMDERYDARIAALEKALRETLGQRDEALEVLREITDADEAAINELHETGFPPGELDLTLISKARAVLAKHPQSGKEAKP